MQSANFLVKDMSCNHCVGSISNALKDLGVKGDVDLDSKRVRVEYDETVTSLEVIKEALVKKGFTVS